MTNSVTPDRDLEWTEADRVALGGLMKIGEMHMRDWCEKEAGACSDWRAGLAILNPRGVRGDVDGSRDGRSRCPSSFLLPWITF